MLTKSYISMGNNPISQIDHDGGYTTYTDQATNRVLALYGENTNMDYDAAIASEISSMRFNNSGAEVSRGSGPEPTYGTVDIGPENSMISRILNGATWETETQTIKEEVDDGGYWTDNESGSRYIKKTKLVDKTITRNVLVGGDKGVDNKGGRGNKNLRSTQGNNFQKVKKGNLKYPKYDFVATKNFSFGMQTHTDNSIMRMSRTFNFNNNISEFQFNFGNGTSATLMQMALDPLGLNPSNFINFSIFEMNGSPLYNSTIYPDRTNGSLLTPSFNNNKHSVISLVNSRINSFTFGGVTTNPSAGFGFNLTIRGKKVSNAYLDVLRYNGYNVQVTKRR